MSPAPHLRLVAGGRARPRRVHTVGSTRDDVVALQTRLKDLALATALAVESCKTLDAPSMAQWTGLSQRVLKFVSTEPGSIDSAARDQGLALGAELAAWGDKLRAAGCAAPIPAPLPIPAPPPSSSSSPFGGLFDKITEPLELVLVLFVLKTVRDLVK